MNADLEDEEVEEINLDPRASNGQPWRRITSYRRQKAATAASGPNAALKGSERLLAIEDTEGPAPIDTADDLSPSQKGDRSQHGRAPMITVDDSAPVGGGEFAPASSSPLSNRSSPVYDPSRAIPRAIRTYSSTPTSAAAADDDGGRYSAGMGSLPGASQTNRMDDVGLPYADGLTYDDLEEYAGEEGEEDDDFDRELPSGEGVLLPTSSGRAYKPYRLGKMAQDDQSMAIINQANVTQGKFDRFQMLNRLHDRHMAAKDASPSRSGRPRGTSTATDEGAQAAQAYVERITGKAGEDDFNNPSTSRGPVKAPKKKNAIRSAHSRNKAYMNNITYVVDDHVHGGMTRIVTQTNEAKMQERIRRMHSLEHKAHEVARNRAEAFAAQHEAEALASLCIQRFWRGLQARRLLARLRKERRQAELMERIRMIELKDHDEAEIREARLRREREEDRKRNIAPRVEQALQKHLERYGGANAHVAMRKARAVDAPEASASSETVAAAQRDPGPSYQSVPTTTFDLLGSSSSGTSVNSPDRSAVPRVISRPGPSPVRMPPVPSNPAMPVAVAWSARETGPAPVPPPPSIAGFVAPSSISGHGARLGENSMGGAGLAASASQLEALNPTGPPKMHLGGSIGLQDPLPRHQQANPHLWQGDRVPARSPSPTPAKPELGHGTFPSVETKKSGGLSIKGFYNSVFHRTAKQAGPAGATRRAPPAAPPDELMVKRSAASLVIQQDLKEKQQLTVAPSNKSAATLGPRPGGFAAVPPDAAPLRLSRGLMPPSLTAMGTGSQRSSQAGRDSGGPEISAQSGTQLLSSLTGQGPGGAAEKSPGSAGPVYATSHQPLVAASNPHLNASFTAGRQGANRPSPLDLSSVPSLNPSVVGSSAATGGSTSHVVFGSVPSNRSPPPRPGAPTKSPARGPPVVPPGRKALSPPPNATFLVGTDPSTQERPSPGQGHRRRISLPGPTVEGTLYEAQGAHTLTPTNPVQQGMSFGLPGGPGGRPLGGTAVSSAGGSVHGGVGLGPLGLKGATPPIIQQPPAAAAAAIKQKRTSIM